MGRFLPEPASLTPEIHYRHEQPNEKYEYCPNWRNAPYGLARLGPKYYPKDPFIKFMDTDTQWYYKPMLFAFTFALTVGGVSFSNTMMRRPAFAQIWKHIGLGSLLGYASTVAFERSRYHYGMRDAVCLYYMDLHPDDFPAVERRKIGDIMRVWKCTRTD